MDSAQNPTASNGAPGPQPGSRTGKKAAARELRREFVSDLENTLPLWAEEFFGGFGAAKLAKNGYTGFAKAVEKKLVGIGADRVLDRPAMDWLWARTVAKLCHKAELDGTAALDPVETIVLFLEREYGNGVERYWQAKAEKSKTIFVKILFPIVGHNGLFESMDDFWDAYSIPDEIRAVLEIKKDAEGNNWVIPDAAGADTKANRPFVKPAFRTLALRPAAGRPLSAPAAVPAPAPAPAPAASPAPTSPPPAAPAATAVSTGLIGLPIKGKKSKPRGVGTGLINLPIRGKRPRDTSDDSDSKDEPMRKVSKTTAAPVDEKE